MIKSSLVFSLLQVLRFAIGARRWLQAVFAVWLALLATVLLLVLMGRLARVPVVLADIQEPQVVVTKTIDPPDPVSGQSAVISFTLLGMGSPQVITRPLDVALAIDVSGSMGWPTNPMLLTGTLASDDAWEPVYTFSIEYLITDSMRATATHPIRFVRHATPTTYYTDTTDYDLRVSPVVTGVWTVEISRAGGAAAYAGALFVPENRLPAATYASKLFVEAISDTDQTAVVPFANTSWVAQPLTSSRPAIHRALDQLVPDGGTRIERGIATAHQELVASGNALNGSKRVMIVMSDGRTKDPQRAFDAAQAAAADGVIIYTIGFGIDVDAPTLMTIAEIGGGKYYFVADSQALQQIYPQIAYDLYDTVATSIFFYDILPSGVTLITDSLAPGWSYALVDGQTIVTRTITDPLHIGEIMAFTLPVRVDWDPGTSGEVNAPGSGITVTMPSSVTTFTPFTNPIATTVDLLLDKRGPDYAFEGQFITYTLWVTNPGPVPVSEVCVADVMGPQATVITASHGGQEVVAFGITAWVWDVGTVTTNSVLSRTLVARVGDEVPDGTTLSNIAGVGRLSEGTCTAPIDGELIMTDTWTVPVTTGLSANKISWDTNGPALYPNDTLVYTVTVLNAGTVLSQTNVFISDSIPASTTFVVGSERSNGEVVVVGDSIVAQVDRLAPGEMLTLTFRVTVNPGTGGDLIINQAHVGSDQQPDPRQPQTVDMVAASGPSVAMSKWVDPAAHRPPPTEAWATYYFRISNTGDATLTDILVWDDQLSPNYGGFFSTPDVPPGSAYTLTHSTPISQDRHNVATVTAKAVGFSGSLTATDDAYFDFIESLGLSLDVSVQPGWIPVSQSVTYTYRLTNISNDWMVGGIISDTLDGPITQGLSLAPGATYTGVFTRWIATTTVNTVYAWGTDRVLSNTAIATDSATVVLDPSGPPYPEDIYLPLIMKNY